MEEKSVPFIVHESSLARAERVIRRLWITILLLIVLLAASNAGWIYYESQWEDIVVTQDTSDGGSNNYIGNDGDIINGKTDY